MKLVVPIVTRNFLSTGTVTLLQYLLVQLISSLSLLLHFRVQVQKIGVVTTLMLLAFKLTVSKVSWILFFMIRLLLFVLPLVPNGVLGTEGVL